MRIIKYLKRWGIGLLPELIKLRDIMNFPVLKPDGLILFPFSWKKYPKRAAAEGQKAKKPPVFAKIFQTHPVHRAQTGKISLRSLRRFSSRFFSLGGNSLGCGCINKTDWLKRKNRIWLNPSSERWAGRPNAQARVRWGQDFCFLFIDWKRKSRPA